MIFTNPVFDACDHEFPHHRSLGSSLIATPRTIRIFSIFGLSIEIIRISKLKVTPLYTIGMIKDHIQEHPDAGLVKSLHHFLEFPDTY